MKTRHIKLIIGFMMCIFILGIFKVTSYASTADVSISSGNVSQGDTVTITVKVSSTEANMGAINFKLRFDPAILEYASGNGTSETAGVIQCSTTDGPTMGDSKTLSFTFKGKAVGNSSISLEEGNLANLSPMFEGDDLMQVSANTASITVEQKTQLSSDSHLAGFTVSAIDKNGKSSNVSYTPSFSTDVYEYKADLSDNMARIIVSTTVSDPSATTKVAGTKLDAGDNKTVITVTAENGSQSQYILYTTCSNQVTTETTTADPNANPNAAETTQTTIYDRSPKELKQFSKYLIQDFSLVTIPSGFDESVTTYGGENVACLKGVKKPLVLLCLADDAQGTNAALYIYVEAIGSFNKMVNIQSADKSYTVIPTDALYTGPEGYTQTALDMNGDLIVAWIKTEGSEFYIVYAMNESGESGLYVYDTIEHTMQRFAEGNKAEGDVNLPADKNEEYISLQKKYDDLQKESNKNNSKKKGIIVILGILFVGALCAIGFIIYHSHKYYEFVDEEESEEESEDDISENQYDENDKSSESNETSDKSANKTNGSVSDEINVESQKSTNRENGALKNDSTSSVKENKLVKNSKTEVSEEISKTEDGILIDMEEDEPFEIEFVDLEDSNDNK